MAKVTISLPDELLRKLESRRRSRKQTRSEFFRDAIEARLAQEEEAALARLYRRGYEELPETEAELDQAKFLSMRALAQEPWD